VIVYTPNFVHCCVPCFCCRGSFLE
jgi:hypothetical protein